MNRNSRFPLKVLTKRRFQRAVTLIEVLVVIAIIATISGIVAFAVFPKLAKAKVQAAVQSAKTIQVAAESYMKMDSTDQNCPNVQTLLQAKQIKSDSTDDPWGTPFRILCDPDTGDIHVYSNGKDKQPDTADDIRDDFKPSDIDRVANLS
jgi:general secretion pathway protein G